MEDINLFLFTYNCGKRGIDPDVFIPKLTKSLPSEISSLYVFGVEEFCTTLDGCYPETSNRQFLKLNDALLKALNSKYGNEYISFHSTGMAHIGAIGIIAITPYASQFTKVRTSQSGCGYFYSSMKGAVGLRLTYKPLLEEKSVDLTFANAHLSAYEGEYYYQRRNQHAIKLMRSLDFGDGYSVLKPGSHTFFMGDLNYRTTKNYDKKSESLKILAGLQDQTIKFTDSIEKVVQKYDELSEGIRNDEIFMGFTEGCINFQPTYKFHVGTAIYNTKRSPSWCDRILYQSTYKNKLEGLADLNKPEPLPKVHKYSSIETILTSDHHPVYLSITIPFDPPESIISSSGYLKILPNDQVIDHFHRDKSAAFTDTTSGPTQIYVKATVLDKFCSTYVTPTSDSVIGHTLWLTTTPGGRLMLLVAALVFLAIWYFL